MKKLTLIIALCIMNQTVMSNEVSKVIESKSVPERAKMLTKLLHASGKACGKATRTFLQGYDKEKSAYWSVSCTNGDSYSVQIPANPSANSRILECGVLKLLGITCFTKLK